MPTLHALKTDYSYTLRVDYAAIPAADAAALQTLAAEVDAGTRSYADAALSVARLAVATTSVANLSYQFFTGATPLARGLDYLVSPTGGNVNNLNSVSYQSFNIENRYINFAVNLGVAGAGAARFAAAYGDLSLADTLTKAYTEIFGFAPTAAKVSELLDSPVPDGQGGAFSRAAYFAAIGHDGANGVGTKAALVGWLLAEAAKADLGVYAQANDAFLADLGVDGLARFHTDLLGTYGAQPAAAAGATIPFAHDQSVSLTQADPALRATAQDDSVTGTSGLDGAQTVATGDGADVIVVTGGAVGGSIDGGAGNDVITVGVLNASVPILGGGVTGTISGGAGNDRITVSQRLIDGAVIDGGAGDDTATVALDGDLYSKTRITGVEHLVFSDSHITYGGLAVGGFTDLTDITSTSNTRLILDDVRDGVVLSLRGVASGGLTANYRLDLIITGHSSTQVGAKAVEVHLDHVSNSATSPTVLTVTGDDGPLILHVDSDSVLSAVSGGASVVVKGLGRLTTSLVDTFKLDASAAAGVDITHIGSATVNQPTLAILSSGDDRVAADLLGQAVSSYTLGGGSDTFTLYQDGYNAPRFANLGINGQTIVSYATITDFAKGVDHLDLGAVIPALTSGLTAFVGAAATLEQALINVSSHLAANATGVFDYAGDAYVYHQDATVGVNAGDGLIRLVGVTGLTTATGAATGDIHYG